MPLDHVHDLACNDKYVHGPEAVVSYKEHKIDTIEDLNKEENVGSGAPPPPKNEESART